MFLILVNLYGVNFGTSSGSPRLAGVQPYNSFKEYIWGGVGDQEELMYGWNMTYMKLNNDAYLDLIIGSPWYDIGSSTDVGVVYIFYGTSGSGFSDINISQADITIRGDGLGNKFGWAVADAGDVNNDGQNDLIVGAPGALNGLGRAYIFHGGNLPTGTISASVEADRILEGITPFGNYGYAVAGPGDIDNDGYDDVVVGAPGADEVIITYSFEKLIFKYIELWDDNPGSSGIVTFDNGVNNTASDLNTWGRLKGDDGWDWIDSFTDTSGLYGHSTGAQDIANNYAPDEPGGPDADNLTLNGRKALEVMVGRTHENPNPYGGGGGDDPMSSAAWGIEFNISSEIIDYVSTNSTIYVSFDYETQDTEGIYGSDATEEASTIRSRIWNSSGVFYIGNRWVSNERYIFYMSQSWGANAWGPITDHFEYDISGLMDVPGTYYWDFGCSFGYSNINNNNYNINEGVVAFFDNAAIYVNNIRNVIIEGAENSGLGSSIACPGDINDDNFADVLIGAPDLDGGHVILLRDMDLLHRNDQFGYLRESVSKVVTIFTGKTPGDAF